MPFWKKKSSSEDVPVPKMVIEKCPQCLHKLNRITELPGLVIQTRYVCPKCGYDGFLYVDDSKNPDPVEEEIWEEMRKEFPELMKESLTTQELAEMSVKNKWTLPQNENHSQVRAWCPFCEDCQNHCKDCKCPTDICSDHARGGLIGELNTKFLGTVELCDVDPIIYQKIVNRFRKLAESGKKE